MGNNITFKTLKKSHAVTVRQPVIYNERFTSGKQIGKVKSRKQIQYCKHLDSIFVEEQLKLDPKASPDSLYLIKGLMTFDEDNTSLKELMDKHPDNKANGGNLFKFLDVEAEELYEIKQYEATDLAKASLSKADDNTVMAVAVWFLGNGSLTKRISKLKIALRLRIDQNPKTGAKSDFVTELNKFFADKNNDEKLMITVALTEGIIRVENGKTVVWSDSDEAIFSGSQPNNVIKEFAVWVKSTEEGAQIIKLISDKVEAL